MRTPLSRINQLMSTRRICTIKLAKFNIGRKLEEVLEARDHRRRYEESCVGLNGRSWPLNFGAQAGDR
jgi:hypothetical protein